MTSEGNQHSDNTLMILYTSERQNVKKVNSFDRIMVVVKLMKHEYNFPIVEFNPTTFASFYTKQQKQQQQSDEENGMSFLKKRCTEILKANLWLTGRKKSTIIHCFR